MRFESFFGRIQNSRFFAAEIHYRYSEISGYRAVLCIAGSLI